MFFRLLEGTKMVQPPAVTEASFYLAAVSLNTKKNRRRCSLLHRCTTDVRVMHGASLLSWLSVSGFITGEKEIVTAKVNPQKISPYIKSTVWSYLPCCVANCERALFTQTLVTHLSPLSKSTLIQTRASSWHHRTRHLHLALEGKPDFGTSCFSSSDLWVNGHIFTHSSQHGKISQLMSHPPARPVLMVITPGSLDAHRFILTKKNKTKKKKPYEQSNSGSLMVTGDICGCCHASELLQ